MDGLDTNRMTQRGDPQAKTTDPSVGRKAIVSVVVPVFNEFEGLNAFHSRMVAVADSYSDVEWEIIYVDDGSTDGSYTKMRSIAEVDVRVALLRFSRNFGHQVAITAGIDKARGDAVVVIDADLQDPPEVIVRFIEKWREGYNVVYGVRERRPGESKVKLLTASFFYRFLKRLTNIEIPVDVGDFRLMDRSAVNQLIRMRESDRFVRGLVSWIGFRQTGIEYARDKRYAGETKYPYRKMIKLALDGITSFSTVPLKLASWLGYLASAFAFFYLCLVFIQKAMGITVPGFATIMVGLMFLGGVQLICLGIVGEYIGRIFTEMKRRPIYIIAETYSAEDKGQLESLPKEEPRLVPGGRG
jgi:glycosyltransferase involved in cell wall biosynthesis